jgi:hypothetical protein
MRNEARGPEQMEPIERLRDAASVLRTTLNKIVRDYHHLDPAEIRKLTSFAKYEADRLLEALQPNAVGRRAMLAERL